MRLHRLVLAAFGPFPHRVELDLDAVAADGIFLVHGATGAGKTSLLDAVCFALYGAVPGSRPGGRSLRSDHAERAAVPFVELEFSAGVRRLRVRRSPEHLRPKRRGDGETTVAASATVQEWVGGSWVPLAGGAQDVGLVVKDVVGLGLEQFAKVVLLPQGDFAAFLKASAEQRREVLERLFDVTRFTDIEAWLAQARRDGAEASARHEGQLSREVGRLSDAVSRVPPGTVEVPADWSARSGPDVDAGVQALLHGLAGHAATALAERDRAEGADRAAAQALALARRIVADRAKGAAAQRSLAQVQGRRVELDQVEMAVGAHYRAVAVRGEIEAHHRARSRADMQRSAVRDALTAVSRLQVTLAPAAPDGSVAGTAHEADLGVVCDPAPVRALVAAVAGHDDLVAELARAIRDHDAAAGRLQTQQARASAASTRVATLQEQRDAVAGRREQLAALAARMPALERELEGVRGALERLRTLLDLRRRLDEHDVTVGRVGVHVDEAREQELALRERWLGLRQAQLEGMAARLAAELRDGHPCPVCGSADHPTPAGAGGAVSDAQVARAETDARTAADRLTDAHTALVQAQTRRSGVLESLAGETRDAATLGEDVARGDALVWQATAALTRAREAADDDLRIGQQLGDVEARLSQARDELVRAQATVSSTTLEVLRLARARDADLARHTRWCPCAGATAREPLAAHGRHVEVSRALARLGEAVERWEQAQAHEAACARAATHGAAAQGFADVAAARDAVLDPGHLAELEATSARATRTTVEAQTVLADRDVVAAVAMDPPDLPRLTLLATDAARARRVAEQAHADAEAAHRAVGGLVGAVVASARRLRDARAHHDAVSRLADAVGGLGCDNTLRMRLSAFVLAARLERVVALANERLARLGDGRYRLAHTDAPAGGGRRSGLGLRVQDLWTGLDRDTATLSGGESFMASLALALGLADAVREEAGGADVRTLFVDEGFGTLDDESLEQVMAVLDGLRDGARCVGVVSHVADLRARIVSQVHVVKTAHGSAVRVLGSGADSAA